MDVKRARDILRSFIRDGKEYSPLIASDWKFRKEDSKIFIFSESNDIDLYFTSYQSFFNDFLFEEAYEINNNEIKGIYYITSVGLVSETEYFQAEDIIEMYNKKIPEKHLVKKRIYLSDKGKEFLYIGSLSLDIFIKKGKILKRETITTDSFLFDIKSYKIVKTNSIRLINLLDKEFKGSSISLRNVELESYLEDKYAMIIYQKINTEINNLRITDVHLDRISFRLDSKYKTNGIYNFIESDEEEYELKDKYTERGDHKHYDSANNIYYYTDLYGRIYKSKVEASSIGGCEP